MLDGITREQFDEWLAYREIEPDVLERIIVILKLGFCALCNSWGAKLKPEDFDPSPNAKRDEALGPQQVAAMLGATVSDALEKAN